MKTREEIMVKINDEKKRLSRLTLEELKTEANKYQLNPGADNKLLIDGLSLLSLSEEELEIYSQDL